MVPNHNHRQNAKHAPILFGSFWCQTFWNAEIACNTTSAAACDACGFIQVCLKILYLESRCFNLPSIDGIPHVPTVFRLSPLDVPENGPYTPKNYQFKKKMIINHQIWSNLGVVPLLSPFFRFIPGTPNKPNTPNNQTGCFPWWRKMLHTKWLKHVETSWNWGQPPYLCLLL